MKYDLVRAWKDDAYRASLDADLADSLPDHPAGDLSDAELSEVCGGGYSPHAKAFSLAGANAAGARFWRDHTFSGFCDFTFGSFTLPAIAIPGLLGFARCPTSQVCGSAP